MALVLMIPASIWLINVIIRRKLRPHDVVIAHELRVTEDWSEFSTKKPAIPPGSMQHIFLMVPGYEFEGFDARFKITLPDGTIVEPQIQVIDEGGIVFDAEDGHRSGKVIGFTVRPTVDGYWISSDSQNVRVRIRSEKPFECAVMGWRTKHLK